MLALHDPDYSNLYFVRNIPVTNNGMINNNSGIKRQIAICKRSQCNAGKKVYTLRKNDNDVVVEYLYDIHL